MSPDSAGFFFVEKKGGELSPCINYRGLDQITEKFPYPLMLFPLALKQLHDTKTFTKLCLHCADNLMRIKPDEEWKTAFSANSGYHEYLAMSYGLLLCAPSVFQRLLNDLLRDMLVKFVIAYINGILIYSLSYQSHVLHNKQVLSCLLKSYM